MYAQRLVCNCWWKQCLLESRMRCDELVAGLSRISPELPSHQNCPSLCLSANSELLLQASALLLAALKPGQLLQRLAAAASAVQQTGGSLPRGVCAFRQWRSVEAALMGWRQHVPGGVLALLSVYAYNQLLASYRGAAGKR
jgi:hypothetical protein